MEEKRDNKKQIQSEIPLHCAVTKTRKGISQNKHVCV